MALTDKNRPQKAHGVLVGILLVGWAIAFTVPRTGTGKLIVFLVVMVVAIAVFIVLFQRAEKEKAEREAEWFLERTLRERGAGVAPAPAPAPAPSAAPSTTAAPAITPIPVAAGPVKAQRWSLELLQKLEPRRFEALCAAYFKALGFRVVARGADDGLDIRLHAEGAATPSHVVQCRARNHGPVGVRPIRELVGAMALEDVPQGILVAAGTFSAQARELAARSPRKLQCIEGKQLLEKLATLAPEKAQALLRLVTG